MDSIRPSSPWWCRKIFLHPSAFYICTYLAHSKSNRAASFHVTIKLTPLFLFILLSIHCFIITESFLELEANMGIIENLIASRIHPYYLYVRTFHTAKQRSCKFLCYNSTNSFPSLFSLSKNITLWRWKTHYLGIWCLKRLILVRGQNSSSSFIALIKHKTEETTNNSSDSTQSCCSLCQ